MNKQDILKQVLPKFYGRLSFQSNTECIHFKGHTNKDGYTEFQFRFEGDKYNVLAHRASYEICIGKLSNSDIVMHSCDNRKCINPNHLVKGTHNDNVQDRVNKSRSATGKDNGNYKHGNYCK